MLINRWSLHRLAYRLGFLYLEQEGGYYRDGCWRYDFWRVLAMRGVRHGIKVETGAVGP